MGCEDNIIYNYQRDQIEQMWLQWGLENQLKVSQNEQSENKDDQSESKDASESQGGISRDKVEHARQKMAELRTD